MDETIFVILKVPFDFALEVWFIIYYTTITMSQKQDRTQNPHNGSNYITQP